MSKRIGELLIARGLLTQAQLEAALRSQLIVGGHLGTSLIELGFVDEDILGRALAETFDVSYASSDMFESIPQPVLATVTKELAARHKVIPLDASKRTLDLAMVCPNDFLALQDLSFATRRRITPWVCPEARIIQALERHYGVSRPRRFVALSAQLDARKNPARPGTSGTDGPAAAALGPAAPGAGGPDPFVASRSRSPVHGRMPPPAGPSGGTAVRTAAVPTTAVVTAVATGTAEAAALSGLLSASPAQAGEESADLEPLAEMLCAADAESEIVHALGALLEKHGERLALFSVRENRATCWGVSGDGLDPARLTGLTFSLEEFTLFHLLREEPYFRGPAPDDAESALFFERLGIEAPAEIALFPMYREGHVEAILYADSGASTGLSLDARSYGALARKAVLARYLVDVKARIRRR